MPAASRINNVTDARRLARRVLPRAVFDYVDGAAEDEVTMAENERGFREIAFRPRMAVRIERPELETTVLGSRVSLPVLLAPCGLVRLMHPDGALGAARAAGGAGTISTLSTVAGTPPEGLAAEPGPRWFQLYAAGRGVAAHLVARARASGFDGLMITVDTPALGKRERDVRNGVSSSFQLSARTVATLGPQMLVRPGWALRMLRTSRRAVEQTPLPGGEPEDGGGREAQRHASAIGTRAVSTTARTADSPAGDDARAPGTGSSAPAGDPGGTVDAGGDDAAPAQAAASTRAASARTATSALAASAGGVSMLASPFTWDDIAWLRERWSGSLLVKGVLTGDDAVRAADAGADAVIVSNHGGRQLEGAPATVRVLPEVVDAVGERVEVLVDGGVRRGGDVIKALAIGARAVLIGRPYLYALAASGQSGVERILEIFRTDMTRSLALMGCPSVSELDRSWIAPQRG